MIILLIAEGNPSSEITWSGVPIRISRELENMGHCVIGADITKSVLWRFVGVLFNRLYRRVFPKWKRIPFKTTGLGLWLSNRWLKKVISSQKHIDLIVSTIFCLDCKHVSIPSILIHDWTPGYKILRANEQTLTPTEEAVERTQLQSLSNASLVVSLYPKSAEYLSKQYGLFGKVHFFCNPINAEKMEFSELEKSIEKRRRSMHLLLVGGKAYQDNVELTIKAVNKIGNPNIVIDVIGLTSAKTPLTCGVIKFYGYLNKSDDKQKKVYDSLYDEARCLINVRKEWGGGSSVAEALYRGLPVIIGLHADLIELYRKAGDAIAFVSGSSLNELVVAVKKCLSRSDDDYEAICKKAHEAVRDDTYNYLLKNTFLELSKKVDKQWKL